MAIMQPHSGCPVMPAGRHCTSHAAWKGHRPGERGLGPWLEGGDVFRRLTNGLEKVCDP